MEIQIAVYKLHLLGENTDNTLEYIQKHMSFMGESIYLVNPMTKIDKIFCELSKKMIDLIQDRVRNLGETWLKRKSGEALNTIELLSKTRQYTEEIKMIHAEMINRLDQIRESSLT